MLEEDGMSFADFLASVQEEEKNGKDGIKLSHIGFLNGKLYAIVNGFWLALYDGDNLELETNVPKTLIDKSELESQLDDVFESYICHPLIETLQNLNSCCEHDENVGMLITDDYNFKQVQEGDRQGWTLVYNKDKKIIAYMNWQVYGCHVETIDVKFYDFLREITKKGAVYAGLDDPELVNDFYIEDFWKTVDEILRLEKKWLKHCSSDKMHLFFQSDKETVAWKNELTEDLRDVVCTKDYCNAKDPIDFALKEVKYISMDKPKCSYKGKKLTRRLIKELIKTAEESL